jgi:hypothetical protein
VDVEWTRERFAVLGPWPEEFVAFVVRDDAPEDLALLEDPRVVRLLDDPTIQGMVRAAADGVSLRVMARALGCSPQTAMRRLRAHGA